MNFISEEDIFLLIECDRIHAQRNRLTLLELDP